MITGQRSAAELKTSVNCTHQVLAADWSNTALVHRMGFMLFTKLKDVTSQQVPMAITRCIAIAHTAVGLSLGIG